jgi:hypothetical protein
MPLSLQPRSALNVGTNTPAGTKGNQPPSNAPQAKAGTPQPDNHRRGVVYTQLPTAPDVNIPAADLRPLYDYMLDCKPVKQSYQPPQEP